MADTKKTAKKADVVKTIDELRAELATKQQDLNDSRRSHKAGELANSRVLGQIRKEIARLHTAIHAAELKEEQ